MVVEPAQIAGLSEDRKRHDRADARKRLKPLKVFVVR